MKRFVNIELSDRELLAIGKIIAQWGILEHEIFFQILKSFDDEDSSNSDLPKEMNNAKFSLLLPLWEERVINKQDKARKTVLKKQHEKILYYCDFRNALAHGMWEWSKSEPEKITAIRIKVKEIKSTHLTLEDLEYLADEIREIYYNVMYPGGTEDEVNALAKIGFYVSRRFICELSKNPKTKDIFPSILNNPT